MALILVEGDKPSYVEFAPTDRIGRFADVGIKEAYLTSSFNLKTVSDELTSVEIDGVMIKPVSPGRDNIEFYCALENGEFYSQEIEVIVLPKVPEVEQVRFRFTKSDFKLLSWLKKRWFFYWGVWLFAERE